MTQVRTVILNKEILAITSTILEYV